MGRSASRGRSRSHSRRKDNKRSRSRSRSRGRGREEKKSRSRSRGGRGGGRSRSRGREQRSRSRSAGGGARPGQAKPKPPKEDDNDEDPVGKTTVVKVPPSRNKPEVWQAEVLVLRPNQKLLPGMPADKVSTVCVRGPYRENEDDANEDAEELRRTVKKCSRDDPKYMFGEARKVAGEQGKREQARKFGGR